VITVAKGSSGNHRLKAGKIRQQGAGASDKRAADRALQAKLSKERGKSTGKGKGK